MEVAGAHLGPRARTPVCAVQVLEEEGRKKEALRSYELAVGGQAACDEAALLPSKDAGAQGTVAWLRNPANVARICVNLAELLLLDRREEEAHRLLSRVADAGWSHLRRLRRPDDMNCAFRTHVGVAMVGAKRYTEARRPSVAHVCHQDSLPQQFMTQPIGISPLLLLGVSNPPAEHLPFAASRGQCATGRNVLAIDKRTRDAFGKSAGQQRAMVRPGRAAAFI